jgi:hypothetical protein
MFPMSEILKLVQVPDIGPDIRKYIKERFLKWQQITSHSYRSNQQMNTNIKSLSTEAHNEYKE